MKGVYFIYADLDDSWIKGTYLTVLKNLEVRQGYIREPHEMNPNHASSSIDVFDEQGTYLSNYLDSVFFDTPEQALKVIAKILASRYEYNKLQNELCDKLLAQYPEALI